MKHVSLVVFSLFLIVFASTAMAGKNAKQIRHCGCVYDSLTGTDMVFHDVLVSGNSKGHRNHLVESDSLCFAGLNESEEPVYELWVRDADDCSVDGLDSNLALCETEVEFDNCGSEAEID